jgi:SH3 domain protein
MYLILIGFLCLTLALPVMAEDIYVSGVTKITMRTGPGTEHKIVAMLRSGTKLETLEYNDDWSLVKAEDDKTGWVLTRFLTREVPLTLLVDQLKKENASLVKALEKAKSRATEFKGKYQSLAGIEKKYKHLENASADYLKLESKYKALQDTASARQDQIRILEGKVDNEELYWALAGAGVFIVGLIIGVSSRRKRHHSLL